MMKDLEYYFKNNYNELSVKARKIFEESDGAAVKEFGEFETVNDVNAFAEEFTADEELTIYGYTVEDMEKLVVEGSLHDDFVKYLQSIGKEANEWDYYDLRDFANEYFTFKIGTTYEDPAGNFEVIDFDMKKNVTVKALDEGPNEGNVYVVPAVEVAYYCNNKVYS